MKKFAEFRVLIELEDSGDFEAEAVRVGLHAAIHKARVQEWLNKPTDETTLIEGFTVSHVGTRPI